MREGLVTETQIRDALRWQQSQKTYHPLGQILLLQKLVTHRQLNMVLDASDKRPRLGDVLVRSGAVTTDQLNHALAEQKKRPMPLGRLLVKLGYVTDDAMRQALGIQLNISYIDLDRMTLDRTLTRVINLNFARRHSLIPVACLAQSLTICMDDPTNRQVVADLTQSTGMLVTVVTSSHDAIRRAFARLYEEKAETTTATEESLDLITEEEQEVGKSKYTEEYRQNKQADVLVRQLLAMAIKQRASDIHLESLSTRLQVRFRVDGVLEQPNLGEAQDRCNDSAREIVSRLKILGKLDIAEKRRPQDGGFRIRVDRGGEQSSVDLRVSVVPGYYGESVVLRLLDRSHAPRSIDQLQFPKAVTDRLRQLLQRSSGILLVTGPTGSGKSTTLYASLMTIYKPQIRVLTAEEPIEYVYEQFSQSEVNPQIGNTFASYLRAFLRHDPEVIMVGEIRDEETAEMAFRAAQTGHLLLSTLHTETAVAAVPRLLDLKIDPNTLASSLIGVVGQRLVRQVCGSCKASYTPLAEVLQEFFDKPPGTLRFFKGQGCQDCNYTGYRGRMTMVELWVPNEEDSLLISKGAPIEHIRASSRRSTFSMADCALAALLQEQTNLEELIRVLPYSTIYEFRQQHGAEHAALLKKAV
ncbi:MAG: ATPase, T2SS/T4P/T4SS family [Vicinamibacterales bacterium]